MDIIKEKLKEINKQKNKEVCKEYYKLHKEEMIKRGCQKIQCSKCNKYISRNRLLKHQETINCKKRQEIKSQLESYYYPPV